MKLQLAYFATCALAATSKITILADVNGIQYYVMPFGAEGIDYAVLSSEPQEFDWNQVDNSISYNDKGYTLYLHVDSTSGTFNFSPNSLSITDNIIKTSYAYTWACSSNLFFTNSATPPDSTCDPVTLKIKPDSPLTSTTSTTSTSSTSSTTSSTTASTQPAGGVCRPRTVTPM